MKATILNEVEPGRIYSSSALLAARHFWTVDEGATASDLADELRDRAAIQVIAVLDGRGAALGVIPRDRLFSLLSKPFGREILGRTRVSELVESVPSIDAHSGIFAVAQEALGPGSGRASPFQVLTDGAGLFKATLSAPDLADYLSRITQDDIDLAGKLQERLQAGNEDIGGESWTFEAWSRAAKGVGGDFYFSKKLADGRSFFAICDVSGKGVAASLVVSMVWGMLQMYDYRLGLRNLVVRLNELIIETFHLEKYLTGYFAIFEPSSGDLLVADMGHSHSLLFRGGRVLAPRSAHPNLPVGIEAGFSPCIARWRLKPGDSLFVYSDGLTEQEGEDGVEFGEGRLVELVRRNRGPRSALGPGLSAALDAYRGRTPQQDDMSFVCLSLAAQAAAEAN